MEYTPENPGNEPGANDGAPIVPTAELVAELTATAERATRELDEVVTAHRHQRERLESAIRLRQEQNVIARAQVRGLTALIERQQGTIGEVDQASKDDAYFVSTLRRVFAVARIKGNASEARHVADEMGMIDLWHEVMADTAYEVAERDGEDAELTKWRAIRQVVEWSDYSQRDRHPMEACYRDLWKQASRIAHQAGYCDEFQTIASRFGIPTDFDFSFSGVVRVHVEGWFDVDVEGDTYGDGQPDAYDEVSHISISDRLDELETSAEWVEYNLED